MPDYPVSVSVPDLDFLAINILFVCHLIPASHVHACTHMHTHTCVHTLFHRPQNLIPLIGGAIRRPGNPSVDSRALRRAATAPTEGKQPRRDHLEPLPGRETDSCGPGETVGVPEV